MNFSPGDKVTCVSSTDPRLIIGKTYVVNSVSLYDGKQTVCLKGVGAAWYSSGFKLYNPSLLSGITSMLTEVKKDLIKFLNEHKGIVYLVAGLLLLDHFVFKGTFRERLKNIMESFIIKVEEKIIGKPATTTTTTPSTDTATTGSK